MDDPVNGATSDIAVAELRDHNNGEFIVNF